MSIYKNGKLIAGGRQCMPLLSFMWADHILNDVSWLRADTFSWQPGSVYQAVYQHLTADITGKTLQSETISGTTIQFYLADDGHKICPVSEESNVTTIYNATGVAWYYILDTANQRFKLPRTKFGFTGIRSGVGNYVEAGLPNITGNIWSDLSNNVRGMQGFGANGAFVVSATGYSQYFERWGDRTGASTISFNASYSSSIYGNSDTVQPKATQMYLYFYVGQFTQTALENTAGVTTEALNGKADVDLSNVSATTRSGFLFSVSQESMSAGNYYTLTFPNEIDPAKVKVNAYAVIKTANNNFVVGDIIPFESLWGQNYRPLSIRIKSTNLQFNTSDQISTNNPNNSGSGVNIVSYIRMVFDVYQVK